jgi:hypothetical protein
MLPKWLREDLLYWCNMEIVLVVARTDKLDCCDVKPVLYCNHTRSAEYFVASWRSVLAFPFRPSLRSTRWNDEHPCGNKKLSRQDTCEVHPMAVSVIYEDWVVKLVATPRGLAKVACMANAWAALEAI